MAACAPAQPWDCGSLTRTGMPSGSPASAIAPPAAMSSMSLAFHALRGPTPPNGRIATTTKRG